MAITKTTSIHFRSNNNEKSNDAVLTTAHYDDKDRLKRALQRFILFLLIAAFSVLIPLAHFLLVPAALFAAFYLGWEAYKTARINEHAKGICPTCEEQITVKFETKDVVPKWTYCPGCGNSLHVDN